MTALLQNMMFIQAIGFVAFGLGVLAMTRHGDRGFKILLSAQALTLSVHFTLLGAHAGAAIAFLAALRNLLSLRYSRYSKKLLSFVFIGLFLIFGLSRYVYWVDALPIAAAVISSYAMFHFDGVRLRGYFLVVTGLWIVHNATVFSIGPFFMECIMFSANFRTILTLKQRSGAGG